jgi:pentapeptide MXKDX repeat protein
MPSKRCPELPGAAPGQTSHTGERMKKLFGSLLLGMFLCVSGAAYAQDAPKQDAPKQDTAKPADTKKEDTSKDKKKKSKKSKKDETKKEEKKPS